MHFIYEKNDLAFGALDFFHDRLQALLEFAAILGPGDEEVRGRAGPIPCREGFRHVAGSHALRKSFGNGSLADARFADEDGIVFRATRKYLDDAHDLGIAADDRIELVLTGAVGERTGKTRQSARFLRLVGVADLPFFDVGSTRASATRSTRKRAKSVRCGSGMFRNTEQEMLGRDELIIERRGDARRRFKDADELRREIELEARARPR